MNEECPLILVVNDDGIMSPGLHATIEVGLMLGEVLVVAPAGQQTAMGRSRPSGPTIGIINPIELDIQGKPQPAYAVEGSPALCVAHALCELTPQKPDLCLSGINYGENIGYSVTASGTLGAALEASSFDIPAIAASIGTPLSMTHASEYAELDWTAAKAHLHALAKTVLARGMPDGVAVLNLNVPSDATPQTEQRVTSLSTQNYYVFDYVGPDARDYSQAHRLSEHRVDDRELFEPDSDVYGFVFDGIVSITPIARKLSAPLQGVSAWAQGD
ncbi:MAG: 5'/3'-nucleotidase SurE [Chloroflexota bacterium]